MDFLKNLFTPKQPRQFSTIQVKYINEHISIFYNGKILTPNVDYSSEPIEPGNYLVKFNQVLNKDKIEVFNCFTSYHTKKTALRPWGFKKFKVATK